MNEKEELQEDIKKIEETLEEMKQKLADTSDEQKGYKRFVPKPGNKYHYINSDGLLCCSWWCDSKVDLWRLYTMPLFRTKEEAIRYKDIHTRIMEIASKYPVEDKADSFYEFSICSSGICYCFRVQDLPIAHAIRTSKDISGEINLTAAKDLIDVSDEEIKQGILYKIHEAIQANDPEEYALDLSDDSIAWCSALIRSFINKLLGGVE